MRISAFSNEIPDNLLILKFDILIGVREGIGLIISIPNFDNKSRMFRQSGFSKAGPPEATIKFLLKKIFPSDDSTINPSEIFSILTTDEDKEKVHELSSHFFNSASLIVEALLDEGKILPSFCTYESTPRFSKKVTIDLLLN